MVLEPKQTTHYISSSEFPFLKRKWKFCSCEKHQVVHRTIQPLKGFRNVTSNGIKTKPNQTVTTVSIHISIEFLSCLNGGMDVLHMPCSLNEFPFDGPKNSHRFFSKTHFFQDNKLGVRPGYNLRRGKLNLILEMRSSEGRLPDESSLLLTYARTGLFSESLAIWDVILNSSFVPDAPFVSELIYTFGSMGEFDIVNRILREMQLKDMKLLPDVFALALSYFGKSGKLECMEKMIKEMVSMGYCVDSTTGNAYVLYHSAYGSLTDAELAYNRLKKSRILIEEEAIRCLSLAYIRENKLYALSCFVRDVGLGRKNVGNLLWNLLLLSYARNFKMKSLQREFIRMVEAGFRPDLNTFNIRALAFSKMLLLWDLHLSLEHMNHEVVIPDIVTYGCVVDAYLDKRLGRNLKFALSKLNWNDSVLMLTDPLIFEVMGKGDFHLSSEIVLEYAKNKDLTYKTLISNYMKKTFRSNQIFWNY